MPTMTASLALMFSNAKRNAVSTCSGELMERPAARILNPRQGFFVWRTRRVISTGSSSRNTSPSILRPASIRLVRGGLLRVELGHPRPGQMGHHPDQLIRHHHGAVRIRGAAVQRDARPVRDEIAAEALRLGTSGSGSSEPPWDSRGGVIEIFGRIREMENPWFNATN